MDAILDTIKKLLTDLNTFTSYLSLVLEGEFPEKPLPYGSIHHYAAEEDEANPEARTPVLTLA